MIDEATCGARQRKACELLELSVRTYQRWTQDEVVLSDGRPEAQRPVPANKLSREEREAILADEGRYLASESSFYRVYKGRIR